MKKKILTTVFILSLVFNSLPFYAAASWIKGEDGKIVVPESVQVPWSNPVLGLRARLLVESTEIKSGQLPRCLMQVQNVSKEIILLNDDFSLNGPAVYGEDGVLCRHRIYFEAMPKEKQSYHAISPGEYISIEVTPNYVMDTPGNYKLYFGIYPIEWGSENPDKPGELLRPASDKWENPMTSNEVIVTIE